MSGRPIHNPQSAIRNYLPIMRHLYVHVPFCQRRCSYCDFSIAVRKRIPVEEYVDAILHEGRRLRDADVDTIYFGGGTPSLLPAEAISTILRELTSLRHMPRAPRAVDVERRPPLDRWISRGAASAPDDERYAEEYLFAHRRLKADGYQFYEVSNSARDGFRSQHNSAYWSGKAYVGLGPAAHSFDGTTRRWNLRAWEAYRRAIAEGRSVVESEETLTDEQREIEAIYLGLRTIEGLPLAAASPRRLSPPPHFAAQGWVEVRDGRLKCTPEGWLRLDSLVNELTMHTEIQQ